MTVKEMAAACGWTLLAGGEGEDNQIDGCYIGDLLSWVMARAQSGNVWITVMGNVNAIDAASKAEMQGIPVYGCGANSYQTAVQVYKLLQ